MIESLYTLDNSPWFEWLQLHSTDSTNLFLKNYRPISPKEMTLVTTEFQTNGRGQAGHSWESVEGRNLLFSLLIHPKNISAEKQFILSQAISLAVCETLSEFSDEFRIKWPNDIYWRDQKIGGILIENSLSGKCIKNCIIGVGLNINQKDFKSDAPNPVSLLQITKKEQETVFILADIVRRFKGYLQAILADNTEPVIQNYLEKLYRKDGFHPYTDKDGSFEAQIHSIEPSGHLNLITPEGVIKRYAFKEVRHLILSPHNSTLAL